MATAQKNVLQQAGTIPSPPCLSSSILDEHVSPCHPLGIVKRFVHDVRACAKSVNHTP